MPIIYLPGVSRATLRATEDCPQDLKPLAELAVSRRVLVAGQRKDWTVAAFLQTEQGGLQLKLAKDQATAASIRRAIEKLVDVPVADLQSKAVSGELNGDYFDSLVSDDLVDDLFSWLSRPEGHARAVGARPLGDALQPCYQRLRLRSRRDGELVGAENLGVQAKAVWKTAWKRFAAAPARYAGLVELLRKAKPQPKVRSLFVQAEESWPQDNEAEETDCGRHLLALASVSVADGTPELVELEQNASASAGVGVGQG